jgi:hypothetical protein
VDSALRRRPVTLYRNTHWGGRRLAYRTVAEHPSPPAGDAPAGAEPSHPPYKSPGLHVQRDRVAVRAAIVLREDPVEHERRRSNPQHEDGHEHDRENREDSV